MFVIAAEFKIVADKIDAFRDLIRWQAERSVAEEPGCHQFDVCQDEADPGIFLLYEVYTDAAAFDDHCAYPRFAEFQAKAKPMLAAEPDVCRMDRFAANLK